MKLIFLVCFCFTQNLFGSVVSDYLTSIQFSKKKNIWVTSEQKPLFPMNQKTALEFEKLKPTLTYECQLKVSEHHMVVAGVSREFNARAVYEVSECQPKG
ncbi:MAG: hypothetical protein CL678_07365 [Bdellovibrionaceae bacterium]|nr:hypothetical protein [Pseudobdellovibrionaceae bacterium]|tara:strand:+ start:3902 stop:4201 length:300 start_codon:yes stop_codon:yes gene_type:complete